MIVLGVQEVGESTPKANAISPNSAFTKRHSAAISELEPLAEVEGEGDGGLSEDTDAPEKGMLPILCCGRLWLTSVLGSVPITQCLVTTALGSYRDSDSDCPH